MSQGVCVRVRSRYESSGTPSRSDGRSAAAPGTEGGSGFEAVEFEPYGAFWDEAGFSDAADEVGEAVMGTDVPQSGCGEKSLPDGADAATTARGGAGHRRSFKGHR